MILSILHTAHHQVFQHSCVRSSMGYYPHFNLAMRSSRGFASAAPNLFALFRLAFASASCHKHLTLLVTVSRRIIMQKARHHPSSEHLHKPLGNPFEIRISKYEIRNKFNANAKQSQNNSNQIHRQTETPTVRGERFLFSICLV